MLTSILLCAAMSCAMPFERGDQGGIIVPVVLNEQGPFRFLLDTGATHSVLSPQTASRIGATPVARSAVGSAAGSTVAAVVLVRHVIIGPVTVADLLPSVMPLDAIDPLRSIDGIIGQDVLAPLRYTIDYRRARLHWLTGSAPAPRGSALALEPHRGRFVVGVPRAGTTLVLVPDSGATTLLLFAGRHTDVRLSGQSAALATLSSVVGAQYGSIRTLTLGARTLRDVPTVVVPPPAEPPGTDGLLPLHLFERVTFDGPGRTLVIK